MVWATFKSALSQPSEPERAPPRTRDVAPPTKSLSLDAIGQRDEVVRQRIGVMLDRLDDLRTIQDDFTAIIEPLVGISEELPRATSRIAELESALAQERQASVRLRQENQEAAQRIAGLTQDLNGTTSRLEMVEADLREHEALVEERQLALRGQVLAIENLERQLFAETEQSKSLAAECKALRLETQTTDAALARSEHEHGAARERIAVLEHDNRRLQAMAEEQAAQLVEVRQRLQEAGAMADAERQQNRALEERLATETAARERAESQYEVEVSALRSERSGLMMKLDAITHRAATSEQILAQVRKQLREKDDAYRTNERTLKEAMIARAAAERRLESFQADMERQSERFLDLQRAKDELASRSDMLNKAIAAKDAANEQAMARNASLAERIEQLIAKHESARAELELVNRRLAEDLENEKSERTLLQGALDIARESRAALQKQHDALKRSGRGWRHAGGPAGEDEAASEAASNVHTFPPWKGQ